MKRVRYSAGTRSDRNSGLSGRLESLTQIAQVFWGDLTQCLTVDLSSAKLGSVCLGDLIVFLLRDRDLFQAHTNCA
jgi:hypothetical protein